MEKGEEIINHQQEDVINIQENVKSAAVVKYSVPTPTTFAQLQCNTDLNHPPSNWLSNSVDSYGLQHVLYQSQGFSSFRMAHMFPDCVGGVDVVSDADNIKNLLKIPYHKGVVSMMVHRVENTLLLDDFDISKHILRTAEAEWEWLRRFFFEVVKSNVSNDIKKLYFKNKRKKALQEKNLVSKFLYHSLVACDTENNLQFKDNSIPMNVPGPVLPEPSKAEGVPDPEGSNDHQFNRNVLWTFEDIQMLIGTDMPIFGGETHPCVSLRLNDMSKPISVLTGIDYWLDNLMSSVPEVVMCYHLNGIVQRYELIKTEDLPRLDNSKFSPQLIRDVAQSILSFLKSNTTKAGHTYWLFKPKDQEVIKLYDLTSLCSKYMLDSDHNPFTVPVAMLLYRVARNMTHSPDTCRKGTIRMLLLNCIKLLPEDKYPEIVTSSHYMLSDLFIPAKTNPESPTLDNDESDDSESVYDDDLQDEFDPDSATKVLILDSNQYYKKFINHYRPPPPILGSTEERCVQAIHHVVEGLNCLQYFHQAYGNQTEAEIPMAKSSEPIPMPYTKLDQVPEDPIDSKKNKKRKEKKKQPDYSPKALLPKNKAEALPTWQEPSDHSSWKQHLRTLLYEKAVLLYAILSEQHYVKQNYGHSLRTIGLLVRCQQVMNKLVHSSNALRENCLLGRAGDCCIMMVQNWNEIERYKFQFHSHLSEDLKMIKQLEKDEQLYGVRHLESNMRCVLIYDIFAIEQILVTSIQCYDEAMKYDGESENMLQRLGNALNEIGTFYLNRARNSTVYAILVDACDKSEPYLKRGIEVFGKIKDSSNVALLYSNVGHLYRILANANRPIDGAEVSSIERLHYNRAFTNYKKAFQVLGVRSNCPGIWDAIQWEMCTTLFNLGTLLCEFPNPEQKQTEAEKEVIEIFQRALKYCDLNDANPRCPLYQLRAAIIYYKLASLYHNSVRGDSHHKKNVVQIVKMNYEKASNLFFASGDAIQYFRAQMQRFAFFEELAESTTALHLKFKNLQNCLDVLIEARVMLQLIIDEKVEVIEDIDSPHHQNSYQTMCSLLKLMKDRLQHILRLLTKLCLNKPPLNKDCSKLGKVYKSAYAASLALEKLELSELAVKLCNVLLCTESHLIDWQ